MFSIKIPKKDTLKCLSDISSHLDFHMSVPHRLDAGHEISLGQMFHWLAVKASHYEFMVLNCLKLKKMLACYRYCDRARQPNVYQVQGWLNRTSWPGLHWCDESTALEWIRSRIVLNRLGRVNLSKQVRAVVTAPIPSR